MTEEISLTEPSGLAIDRLNELYGEAQSMNKRAGAAEAVSPAILRGASLLARSVLAAADEICAALRSGAAT